MGHSYMACTDINNLFCFQYSLCFNEIVWTNFKLCRRTTDAQEQAEIDVLNINSPPELSAK